MSLTPCATCDCTHSLPSSAMELNSRGGCWVQAADFKGAPLQLHAKGRGMRRRTEAYDRKVTVRGRKVADSGGGGEGGGGGGGGGGGEGGHHAPRALLQEEHKLLLHNRSLYSEILLGGPEVALFGVINEVAARAARVCIDSGTKVLGVPCLYLLCSSLLPLGYIWIGMARPAADDSLP
jgi:hypothetical protein